MNTTTTTLIAFHGDAAIKTKYLDRVKAHREADELIKGTYWQNGKGCAVGCTVHSDSHAAYEVELGIPRSLARIEDGIFEGLTNGEAKLWPERFLSAIPVGADLSKVTDQFLFWLLLDPDHGVINFARSDRSKKSIQDVGAMYQRKLAGEIIPASQWRAAASASSSAAASAASASSSAAAAAADAAAAYAAYAADAAAAYAAYAAAFSDAWRAARLKQRAIQADKLVELLGDCQAPSGAVRAAGSVAADR